MNVSDDLRNLFDQLPEKLRYILDDIERASESHGYGLHVAFRDAIANLAVPRRKKPVRGSANTFALLGYPQTLLSDRRAGAHIDKLQRRDRWRDRVVESLYVATRPTEEWQATHDRFRERSEEAAAHLGYGKGREWCALYRQTRYEKRERSGGDGKSVGARTVK